jgi:Ser/Thr protein kinase RdoA (MazF antagonist)
MEKQKPENRLNYTGALKPVLDRMATAYGIGKISNFSIIEVGYEDCNVAIETTKSKYLAKIFSKKRTPEDISRYTKIMEVVTANGVNHPTIIKPHNSSFVYVDNEASNITMILMQFVNGKTFLELGRPPTQIELQKVLEQASKINKINYHPEDIHDSWAIPNICEMFKRVNRFIDTEDKPLIEEVILKYSQIPIEKLPHCFVHGDFTKANIIKSDSGELYILDFSVSNWYPRIQELAVITANLLYDKDDQTPLKEKCSTVASKYNKLNPLTQDEKDNLYHYTLAAVAMEFMGAHQERFINGNDTEETRYWFDLGRHSLIKELR